MLLHQTRRTELLDEAYWALQRILDANHLRGRASLFGGATDLKILAESAHSVVALDRLADFSGGSYGWNVSPADPQRLVELAGLLEARYQELSPAVLESTTRQPDQS